MFAKAADQSGLWGTFASTVFRLIWEN